MQFPEPNRDTVKLLRLCLDYGVERIISIKNEISLGVAPSIDLVRSYINTRYIG